MTVQLGEDDFDKVIAGDTAVLVDFYTPT